ncbi:replication protein P [Litoribrevibacter albus]|uniref:Replication protein P n=1 Tax=Litoribrevibacter albus TaxID=1473156 RepID=A0AA37SB18_9GAMM|nr:replication protein P [Litoribrevibacter albus]GLQ31628.1 hypothetical protein GCM10007876_21070 [Litoribrevibacter albus]
MQTVTQITQGMTKQSQPAKPAQGEFQQKPARELSPDAVRIVNYLFQRLRSCFPAWKNSFPDADSWKLAKQAWVDAFIEHGICTHDQLNHGIRKATEVGSPFWPSVGQFVQWCKPTPEDFGLPSVQEAYFEAAKNASRVRSHKFSHPAVRLAGGATGWFELASQPESKIFKRFERNYQVLVNRVMAGEDLSAEIPKALPSGVVTRPAPKTVALASLDQLKAALS